jgi:hypothetical protein
MNQAGRSNYQQQGRGQPNQRIAILDEGFKVPSPASGMI